MEHVHLLKQWKGATWTTVITPHELRALIEMAGGRREAARKAVEKHLSSVHSREWPQKNSVSPNQPRRIDSKD